MDKLMYDELARHVRELSPTMIIDISAEKIKEKVDVGVLVSELEQSRYLCGFQKLSQLIRQYMSITSGKYRDFKKSEDKSNGTHLHSGRFKGERAYTKQELDSAFSSLGSIDDLLN